MQPLSASSMGLIQIASKPASLSMGSRVGDEIFARLLLWLANQSASLSPISRVLKASKALERKIGRATNHRPLASGPEVVGARGPASCGASHLPVTERAR